MYEEKLALYDELVAQCPDFERKGKTMPYTSANGHMFSLLNKAGELGIRLPQGRQQELIDSHGCTEFRSHGARMRDYVLIPDSLLADKAAVIGLLKEGFAFANSLPPK